MSCATAQVQPNSKQGMACQVLLCVLAGVYCNGCSCTDCLNLQVNDELITRERNRILQREGPQAFGRKASQAGQPLTCNSSTAKQSARARAFCNHDSPLHEAVLYMIESASSSSMHDSISTCVMQNAIQAAGVHLKGCRCSRSKCAKKYCECFDYQVPCSELCK